MRWCGSTQSRCVFLPRESGVWAWIWVLMVSFFEQKNRVWRCTARAGAPLHTPATSSADAGVTPQDPNEPWRVPAQRRRVTEYLVLEKKGWAVYPWQFREQMW